MITPELVQYIQNNLATGKTRDQIQKDLLIAGGWQVSDIQEAFASIDGKTSSHNTGKRSGFGTFFIVLLILGGLAFGAEKLYGPAISEKIAAVLSVNPFSTPAATPAANNNTLLNQAPTAGIPIADVSTPAVAPVTVAVTPPPLAPGTCADNDMACFLKAATACTVASVNNTASSSLFGVRVTATSTYSTAPSTSGCVLTINTQNVPPTEGTCTFAKKSDLAAVIKNWQKNVYSTNDFAKAACTGTYFN